MIHDQLFEGRSQLRVRSVTLDPEDAPQRQREKLARILLDDMYQFVALLDRQGTLLEVNRAALEGGGIALEEICGKPFWEARWWTISGDTQERLRQSVARAASGEFIRYDVEVYGRASGEETIVIDFSIIPVFDAAGEVVFLLPEGRDITQKTLAEAEIARKTQELQALYDRVREVDEVKSQLFANVSHELRTPLALILGPVERMLREDQLEARQQRDLAVVQRNASMLLKRVNDLLDVARLDAGRMTIDYAAFDLAALVRLLAANFEAVAAQRQIRFKLELPAELPVEGDADKLERVLLNLLSNAFKFTPDGGRIVLSLRVAAERVLLAVQDSGPGVPEALRPQLFQRFRQGEGGTSRRFGGTGLGLSIVKDFVDLHQGTVGIAAAAGGGALFQVELPLRAPAGSQVRRREGQLPQQDGSTAGVLAELEPPALPAQAQTGAAGGDPQRPCVLVVEDNQELNRFLVEVLVNDFRVVSAYDGRSGLEQAREVQPDLILSDIMMPVLSGDQMIAELRADPRFARVPIIVLSAKADDQLRLQLLRSGAQDYLMKPFSEEELRSRVHNLVALKRARDALENRSRTLEAAVAERTRALTTSEVRFRELAEAMPQIVWTADGAGKVDYYNRRGRDLTGQPLPSEDWEGWELVVHEDERQATIEAWGDAIARGQGYEIEHRIQHADGSFRWMLSRAVPACEDGRVLRWYGTATDIDGLKQAEQALRLREHELWELTEGLPQLIWTTCRDGTAESFNQRWYDYTGLDLAASIGYGWMQALHPDDLASTAQQWQQAQSDRRGYEQEYRIRGVDGSFRWFLGRGIPLWGEDGTVQRWFGTCTDIHAQKLLQQELERRTEELRQANQDLEQFAYVASHDLQEPLRMVSLNLGLIEDRLEIDDALLERSFAYVRSGAERMRDLIASTLHYTRLALDENGAPEWTDPRAVVAEVVHGLGALIQDSGGMICLDVSAGRMQVPRSMLAQVFQNLLGNACKYRSDQPLRIVISGAGNPEDGWTFGVQDNGIGIAASAAERVFDMFHRLRVDQRVDGSGMGLTICRKIVERLGGRIWLDPGAEGSTFRFTLPAGPAPEHEGSS